MTKKLPKSLGGKAALGAAAIGSAAVAAALLYASKRKEKKAEQPGTIPSGEKPETD
ncbi:isopropylmalate isomerase [Altererythrobacter luteolus]|uniref:Isopropylmalate isomerase n=1 Tax=Pontixanthobacter luteolus TaxID=295089 RepID=A0A6I4UWP0_9SPHN|nr:isopropylmalate isomerase [Pontixanthobacter luteolus]MXP45973.1 isopropylmalate isomerase [Pontixanthobacter luteolus]